MVTKKKTSTSKKTETKSTTAAATVDPRVEKYLALENLNEALVKEIDHAMMSRLQPGQLGQILGHIVSNFKKQLDTIKKS